MLRNATFTEPEFIFFKYNYGSRNGAGDFLKKLLTKIFKVLLCRSYDIKYETVKCKTE